jgi:hypothetical protein
VYTSALPTRCFSREWIVLGMLRPAGATLTVLIATTIGRCLSVRVVQSRWRVFVFLRPSRPGTFRPGTTRPGGPLDITRQDASTRNPPSAPLRNEVMAQVRMYPDFHDILLKPAEQASTEGAVRLR